jgi:serine/threonine protein kinase
VTTTTPEARVGTTLADKYELVQLLGVGGSGAVFEARHHRTGARYAIKLLLPSADRAEAERMLREARALAKLDHDHIVRLVDLDEDGDGELYLVEELLRGRTLRALLDEELLLSPRRALELLVPILRGLGYAHGRGIVHRDLKPENIFLSEDASGRVTPKLLDFGLVREATTSGGTTRPGTLLGTPRYMSPEQAWGRDDVDGRSDLWSLAVVLYECLSGVCPFDGANDRAVLAAIVTTDAAHLRTTGVAVDEALADAVMLALTRAPEARVPSATAWEAALAQLPALANEPWHRALFPSATPTIDSPPVSSRSTGGTPEIPRSATRHRATLVVSSLALLALLALGWMALRPNGLGATVDTTNHETTGTVPSSTSEERTPRIEAESRTGMQASNGALPVPPQIGIQTVPTESSRDPLTLVPEPGHSADPSTGTLPAEATAPPARSIRRTGLPPTQAAGSADPGTTADSIPAGGADSRPTTGPNAAPLVDDL